MVSSPVDASSTWRRPYLEEKAMAKHIHKSGGKTGGKIKRIAKLPAARLGGFIAKIHFKVPLNTRFRRRLKYPVALGGGAKIR